MKNIKLLHPDKYNDSNRYQLVEEGIYVDLGDSDNTNHRISISFELEETEDTQYPIEDVMDKYNLYVSDFLTGGDSAGTLCHEFGGELDDIRQAKVILGKRVYNREYTKDGNVYVELVIE